MIDFYQKLLFAFIITAFIATTNSLLSAEIIDSDGDGISDEIERKLGTNPKFAEKLILLFDDKTKDKGDETISETQKLAPDITKVWFAHVGGKRCIFKVEFEEEYTGKGNVFHLYVDADDNKSTGRQDKEFAKGVDIMYSFVNGKPSPRIITPSVRVSPEIPVRQLIVGNAIYVCDDVKFKLSNEHTGFRTYLLSHRVNPTSDSDRTDWTYVEAPVNPNRDAPKLIYPQRQNFEVIPAWYELLYNLWNDDGTVRLLQKDAEVSGFIKHNNDDFEGKGDQSERATWKCPVDGEYYIALVLYDEPAVWEALDVEVNGENVGKVVGAFNRDTRLLFYSSNPIQLHEGDRIEISQSEQPAPVRFRDVALCSTKPQVPELRIENLTSFMLPDEPGKRSNRMLLTWTTNRPAKCTVQYQSLDSSSDSGEFGEEQGAVQLHQISLPEKLKAKRYQFSVFAKEPSSEMYRPQQAESETIEVDMTTRLVENFELKSDKLELTVHEPTSDSRDSWWVTSGIPFPDKTIISPEKCQLKDGNGHLVPAQFSAMSYWRSGAVKWLRCDFLAKTQTESDASYVLEYNVELVSTPNPFVIQENEKSLTVSTGTLICNLSKESFAPFAKIGVDRDGDGKLSSDEMMTEHIHNGGGFELTDADGTLYSTTFSEPEEIVVEERGPVRSTVRIRGDFASADGDKFMRYLCRLHFYANKPWMRVVFSLDNDIAKPQMSLISSASAFVPLNLTDASYYFGGDSEKDSVSDKQVRLLQDYDNHYAITPNQLEGERAKGFVHLKTSNGSLLASVRNFWQMYPKGFTVNREGLRVELLPKLPPEQYATEQKDEDSVTKLYFWCKDGHYKIRHGVRLTKELWFDFDAPDNSQDVTAEGEWIQKPLFAAAKPEWYCKSNVIGPLYPRREGWFDTYEANLDSAFDKFLDRREKEREYGFINYGDWFGERKWNWGNCEYDTPWCFALNFMRTGDLELLWRGDEAEWHHGDIDVVHYGNVGKVWAHSTGHTGGYFPRSWKNMGGFNSGSSGWGHTWCRGHFALGALTCERRYYKNGIIVADRIARTTTNFDFGSERDVGWKLLSVMGAYQFTGNPVYLNAAKLMADVAIWKQHPERGLWGHFIWECRNSHKHFPPHWGAKPFMTGVLLHGLKLYDLEQPREDVKQTIRKNCDFLWRECYIPEDNGFIYAQCSAYWDKGSTWTISMVGDGLAYGCLISPQNRHKELLIQAVSGNIYKAGVSSFGKSFSQATCFYPYMLHDLTELGITDVEEIHRD